MYQKKRKTDTSNIS